MSRRPGAKGRRDRVLSVFQLPDYGSRACLRGRTADKMPAADGVGTMGTAAAPNTSLEHRTIEAHRAYIDVLIALERARHRANCPACAARAGEAGGESLEAAERHSEMCFTRLRNLLDELGYIPANLSASLPDADETACVS